MKNKRFLIIAILSLSLSLTSLATITGCSSKGDDEKAQTDDINAAQIVQSTEAEDIELIASPKVEPKPFFMEGKEVKDVILPNLNDGVILAHTIEELIAHVLTYDGYTSVDDLGEFEEFKRKYKNHTREDYDEIKSRLTKVFETFKPGAVVIGEYIDETTSELEYRDDESFGGEVVVDGMSHNRLKVIQVLAGDVKEGDIIPISQNYSFEDDRNAILCFDSVMTPMHKGDRYIHFLNYGEKAEGYMDVVGTRTLGRYPVPNDKLYQAAEKCLEFIDEREKWLNERESMSREEAIEKGIKFGRDENGGSYLDFKGSGKVYYLTAEEEAEFIKMQYDFLNSGFNDNIEPYELGTYNKKDFQFFMYAYALRYFDIKPQEWANEGQGYDAFLIQLRQNKLDEYRKEHPEVFCDECDEVINECICGGGIGE